VDDERIKQLTAEVMEALRSSATHSSATHSSADTVDLEIRVAALEKAVRGHGAVSVQVVSASVNQGYSHPSQSLLGPPTTPGERCVMEPDKPCVQSGMCRTLGH
jgi:hypothetical protein